MCTYYIAGLITIIGKAKAIKNYMSPVSVVGRELHVTRIRLQIMSPLILVSMKKAVSVSHEQIAVY